ncbi:hypothetical protein [Flavobacterium sp. HSC-61S13]|uniref:hypothetical protein n=1 Tax=Flavobacterium sp. HSC-61S13 TaxID=2910963 RepID=UPI0020A1FA9F|nr:hypothetical protein [Flavobacterium sp. HSC-61S13]MCP1996482.1 hypothetical protein [Flavobacterium sp. HSC-61S13]
MKLLALKFILNRTFLYYLLLTLFTMVAVFSQTGINTISPTATFEISRNQGISFENGVLLPHITGLELANKDALYTEEQDGVLIYVTEGIPYNLVTPKTVEVTRKGKYIYYHEPNQRWRATFNGKSTVSTQKIFTVINSESTKLMSSNTESVKWDVDLEGTNSHLVGISGSGSTANTEIVLPPYRTLIIQGLISIAIGSGTESQKKTPTTLRSDLLLIDPASDVRLHTSTPGYSRSSNYTKTSQGGPSPAVMIVYTGSSGVRIKTNVTREPGVRTNIAGKVSTGTIGSYLIIEEI